MRYGMLAATVIFCLSAGCAQVPTAAVEVSRQAGTGIAALGENGKALVDAWQEGVAL